jgi:glutamate decarboxylase
MVMGINVQVCWEKFADYFEVEPRYVPMDGDGFGLSAETAVELCDENTIGVVAVLGSTFDGCYEPVAEIAAALDALQERTGIDVPVHVDGASGGMIAPFLDPEPQWGFRLPRVASIDTSGHKYGLVMPGVGWALWRDAAALPDDLVFHVNYLGGDIPTFALNFSVPAPRSSPSTTTSCGWASTVTAPSSRPAGTSRCGCRARSPRWGRSPCSPTAANCPSSPSG